MSTTSKNRVSLKGSERAALPGALISRPIDPNERIRVTVMVRRNPSSKELTAMAKEIDAQKIKDRKYLSREEFAASHGADPEDLRKIEDFAQEHGLDVVEVNAAQRRIVLEGTAAAPGYQILVDGQQTTELGLGAVAPLWAGLISLLNQKLGKPVGFINPVLYSLPTSANAFHDITVGNNDITGKNGPYPRRRSWLGCMHRFGNPGWDEAAKWIKRALRKFDCEVRA